MMIINQSNKDFYPQQAAIKLKFHIIYKVILFSTYFQTIADNFLSTGLYGCDKLTGQDNNPMNSIVFSSLAYFLFHQFNDWLFVSLEFHTGANYIYLPAGLRLLSTLLLGVEGAIGLFVGSLAITATNMPGMNLVTMLGASIISAGVPYIVYRAALHFGMASTLENLSVKSLFLLTFVYSLSSSTAHAVWYWLRGVSDDFLGTLSVMFIGDLIGTLIIIYTIKFFLFVFDRFRKKYESPNDDQ